jgi:hypothetical protein
LRPIPVAVGKSARALYRKVQIQQDALSWKRAISVESSQRFGSMTELKSALVETT